MPVITIFEVNCFSYFRTMSDVYFLIAGIILMLLFVAFFSGIEIAFINANRLGIELKKKQGKLSGIIMSRFMDLPSRFGGLCAPLTKRASRQFFILAT